LSPPSFFLFFVPVDAHRALLSFPTRRSSDLQTTRYCPACGAARCDVCGEREDPRRGRRAPPRARAAGKAVRLRGADADPLRPSEDRKSTRLNSSHVKISYAVFCLKKKTA